MFKIAQKPEPTKTSKPAKAALSLFDDEEEEEEGDIFGAPATKKAPTKSAATNKVNIEILMKLTYLWLKFKQFFPLLDS